MYKATFLKEFQFSRRLQKALIRSVNETNEEYDHRIKTAKYGLEGEDRVNFQLASLNLPIVCLSDVRIEEMCGSAQADFIVISKNIVYVIEVKNLYGSIRITPNDDVIRLLPRTNYIEEEGIDNPFTQVRRQANVFESLFKSYNYSYEFRILIIMANPRTVIYPAEHKAPMIRCDKISDFFNEQINDHCSQEEYNQMMDIGKILLSKNKERYFNNFESMRKIFMDHNKYIPKMTDDDMKLYEAILECRRVISKRVNIPLCNIFLNREAEELTLIKPTNKEEFLKVPGFKEKKYLLCGEEVIEIIKNHIARNKQ